MVISECHQNNMHTDIHECCQFYLCLCIRKIDNKNWPHFTFRLDYNNIHIHFGCHVAQLLTRFARQFARKYKITKWILFCMSTTKYEIMEYCCEAAFPCNVPNWMRGISLIWYMAFSTLETNERTNTHTHRQRKLWAAIQALIQIKWVSLFLVVLIFCAPLTSASLQNDSIQKAYK